MQLSDCRPSVRYHRGPISLHVSSAFSQAHRSGAMKKSPGEVVDRPLECRKAMSTRLLIHAPSPHLSAGKGQKQSGEGVKKSRRLSLAHRAVSWPESSARSRGRAWEMPCDGVMSGRSARSATRSSINANHYAGIRSSLKPPTCQSWAETPKTCTVGKYVCLRGSRRKREELRKSQNKEGRITLQRPSLSHRL